jgi:hypothetical protein
MAYKMKPKGMGNNSYGMMPSNNKPKGKMAKIKGAGERRVVGGSGFIGYLGGGAAKLGMKIAAKLTGHTAVKSGSKVYGYEKGGKMTNTFKGLFNKSVKDKPAYGIDQYKYANTKGRASVQKIKEGYVGQVLKHGFKKTTALRNAGVKSTKDLRYADKSWTPSAIKKNQPK